MVVFSVLLPDPFFPDISTLFCPSCKPMLVVTTPSGLNEKLVVLIPFTDTVTSFQEPTFVVCALKEKTLFSTVAGEAGLINLIAGGATRTGGATTGGATLVGGTVTGTPTGTVTVTGLVMGLLVAGVVLVPVKLVLFAFRDDRPPILHLKPRDV